MKQYIFYDIGIVLLTVVILLFMAIIGSVAALDKIINFFIEPLKYILLIVALIIAIVETIIVAVDCELNYFQRIIGSAINAICSTATVGISFIFLLCIFIGFLQNVEKGHPIIAFFAIVSDLVVFVLCFLCLVLVRFLPYTCITDRFPILFFVIVNIILSVLFFCILQSLCIGYYKSTIELIFKDYPWIIRCLCYPLGDTLLKMVL